MCYFECAHDNIEKRAVYRFIYRLNTMDHDFHIYYTNRVCFSCCFIFICLSFKTIQFLVDWWACICVWCRFQFSHQRKKYIYIKWTEVWIGEYECMYRDLYQTKTKKLSFVRCCFVCCLGVMAQFYLLIICLHAVSCYCCLHHSVARSRALSSLLSACMNWIWVGETNHFKWFYKEYTLVIEEMIVLYGSFEVGVCVFPNFVERFENRLT